MHDDHERSKDNTCYPRNVLKFCPRCASRRFAYRVDDSFLCAECGFQFFINAAAAVVALITDLEGRLLLVRRAREPKKGTLDLPGGFVDPGETAEHALAREIREELNLEIERFSYFCSHPNTYLYGGIVYFTLDLAFACSVRDMSRLEAGDDAGECIFMPLKEIRLEEIGLDSIREIVRLYGAGKKVV